MMGVSLFTPIKFIFGGNMIEKLGSLFKKDLDEFKKIKVLFKNNENKNIKQCYLSRVPRVEECVVFDYVDAETTVTFKMTWRVYHVITIMEPEEKVIVFVQNCQDYMNLYTQNKK